MMADRRTQQRAEAPIPDRPIWVLGSPPQTAEIDGRLLPTTDHVRIRVRQGAHVASVAIHPVAIDWFVEQWLKFRASTGDQR